MLWCSSPGRWATGDEAGSRGVSPSFEYVVCCLLFGAWGGGRRTRPGRQYWGFPAERCWTIE